MMSELFVVFAILHFAIAATCGYLLWVHFFKFVTDTYDKQIKSLKEIALEKESALKEANERVEKENHSLIKTIEEFETILKDRMYKK
jgi:DNA anti-recombination protein RmuC